MIINWVWMEQLPIFWERPSPVFSEEIILAFKQSGKTAFIHLPPKLLQQACTIWGVLEREHSLCMWVATVRRVPVREFQLGVDVFTHTPACLISVEVAGNMKLNL